MTKSKLTGALAVLTLATALALPSAEAQAKPKWGLVAAGVIGGVAIGSAIAHAHAYPYYYDGYRRCRMVRQYNDFGFYVGRARVCYHD
ncbi:MAG: hypothetical protein FJX62_00040 [Alphaproteobacteria bacterium]|nr:hypothetical protein [Alphaproteobacteria bacterium]